MHISIAIKSCHQHHARRQAVADTWFRQLPVSVDAFFVVGNPAIIMADTISCNVSDAFENIAPKVLCACLAAKDSKADWLFVCDDDTFVRASQLLGAIPHGHDYVGFVRPYGDVSTNGLPYIQGSAYWLSRKAIDYVIEAGERVMRPGIIDDGAVGVALAGKVLLTHDPRYWPGPDATAAPAGAIAFHKCDPHVMRAMHKAGM